MTQDTGGHSWGTVLDVVKKNHNLTVRWGDGHNVQQRMNMHLQYCRLCDVLFGTSPKIWKVFDRLVDVLAMFETMGFVLYEAYM